MKQQVMVAAVTTWVALENAVKDGYKALSIENPLYRKIHSHVCLYRILEEYDIEILTEKQIILLRKRRGENAFDPQTHELYYLPLEWDDWHS